MEIKASPITIFLQDLKGGGAEKIAVQMANGFAENGYPVDFICQSLEGVYVGSVSKSVNTITIGSISPFKAVLFLVEYMKRTNPHVVFAIMEKPSLLGIVASFFARYHRVVPCVHTDLAAYVMLDHRFRRRILALLVAIFYRAAAKVIVVSDGASTILRHMLGTTPIEVVYNGFDLEDLRTRSREKVDLPFPENKQIPVFIACGRMVPQKGFDILLQAFAKLRKDVPARLIVLGDGPQKESLVRLSRDLEIENDLYLPGFVSAPSAWFAHSDVFVLSSRNEGFGNVLVEAIVAGSKVVSTNCRSGPAEILESGKYGLLVPVEDADALAMAMKASLVRRDDQAEMNAAAQAHIAKNYSMETMIKGYLAVMESLP